MTTTVTDEASGITIHTGPSDAEPEKVNVVIYGPSCDAVQQCIFDLADEYNNVVFANPTQMESKRWGAMGRVW